MGRAGMDASSKSVLRAISMFHILAGPVPEQERRQHRPCKMNDLRGTFAAHAKRPEIDIFGEVGKPEMRSNINRVQTTIL